MGKNNVQNKKMLYFHEKVKAIYLKCILNMAVLFFILENISQSLFEKHFYFPTFCLCFYGQIVFVFHLQRDFDIVHAHIVAFFLLQERF